MMSGGDSSSASGTDPLVLDVRDVAERLRISRSFAYELIASGRLPSIRLGRRVLVPAVRLDEFLLGEDSR
jgi:excisionase family DNA binding protein